MESDIKAMFEYLSHPGIPGVTLCFCKRIESTKTTSMEDASTGVLETIKNI